METLTEMATEMVATEMVATEMVATEMETTTVAVPSTCLGAHLRVEVRVPAARTAAPSTIYSDVPVRATAGLARAAV